MSYWQIVARPRRGKMSVTFQTQTPGVSGKGNWTPYSWRTKHAGYHWANWDEWTGESYSSLKSLIERAHIGDQRTGKTSNLVYKFFVWVSFDLCMCKMGVVTKSNGCWTLSFTRNIFVNKQTCLTNWTIFSPLVPSFNQCFAIESFRLSISWCCPMIDVWHTLCNIWPTFI